MYERIKKFYDMGIYTKQQVHQFAEKGVITAEQYELITGEPYDVADTEASKTDMENALGELGV